METNRRGQIIVETFRAETQHDNEFSYCAEAPLREVAVARIRAANMCAERAAPSRCIAFVGKLVLLHRLWVGTRNRLILNWHQRVAWLCAANHFRAQLASLRKIPTSLLVKELPKVSNVLFQLPHDEIGPVAP